MVLAFGCRGHKLKKAHSYNLYLPSPRPRGELRYACLIRSWGSSIVLVWATDECYGALSNGDDT